MNTNEIFNQMLSSYDITTELQKRNAIFEVNQQIILSGLYNGGFFSTRQLSMVEHVCVYSMDCIVSLRIWIFPYLLRMKTLILHIIFSPSLTNSL